MRRTITIFERPGFHYFNIEPPVDHEVLSGIPRPHKNFPAHNAHVGHWPLSYLATNASDRQILGFADSALGERVDMMEYAQRVAKRIGAVVTQPVLSEAEFDALQTAQPESALYPPESKLA